MLVCHLALSGCSLFKNGPDAVRLEMPAVIEFATVRCPPADATIKNEWSRRLPTAEELWANRTDPVTTGEILDHLRKHEVAQVRKNGYGRIQQGEYERCRSGESGKTPSS